MPDPAANPIPEPDIIVLIHGTFAASPEDCGGAWWQKGSAPWNEFRQHLPDGAVLDDEVFHWSGENTVSARIAGARKLADRLVKLERMGRSYHLVAHSHGGSLVWEALKLTMLDISYFQDLCRPFRERKSSSPSPMWLKLIRLIGKLMLFILIGRNLNEKMSDPFKGYQGLQGLKSWTSVGTPFVRLRSSYTSRRSGWCFLVVNMFFAALLLSVSMALIFFEVVWLLMWCFGDDPPASLEMGTAVGYVAATVACWSVGISLVIPLLQIESLNEELRTEHAILQKYGHRWLGLWSPDDEAINGLKLALSLAGNIMPRTVKNTPSFYAPKYAFLLWPVRVLINPLASLCLRILAPLGDGFIWSHLKRNLAGNDRPGTEVYAILPVPVEGLENCPHLPQDMCNQLRVEADREAANLSPRLRAGLAAAAIRGGLAAFVNADTTGFTGRELVHTSYFSQQSVMSLVSQHVASNMTITEQAAVGRAAPIISPAKWLGEFATLRDEGLSRLKPVDFPFARYATWFLSAVGVLIFAWLAWQAWFSPQ